MSVCVFVCGLIHRQQAQSSMFITHTHTFSFSLSFAYTHADEPFLEIKASNKTSLFSSAEAYTHAHTQSWHVSPAHKQPLIVAHTADIWKKGHTFLSLSRSPSLSFRPPSLRTSRQATTPGNFLPCAANSVFAVRLHGCLIHVTQLASSNGQFVCPQCEYAMLCEAFTDK